MTKARYLIEQFKYEQSLSEGFKIVKTSKIDDSNKKLNKMANELEKLSNKIATEIHKRKELSKGNHQEYARLIELQSQIYSAVMRIQDILETQIQQPEKFTLKNITR
jgi:peptidoglycan hydrolase CwlO-like protein